MTTHRDFEHNSVAADGLQTARATADAGQAAQGSLVEPIVADGEPLVYVVRGQQLPNETTFLTPSEANLQVGYIVYPAGHEITRHDHRPIERHIVGTCEVLAVQRGSCTIDVYDRQRQPVASRELRAGDVVVIVSGGHGFRMTEDTVLLEIKQGPYPGVAEKERF